MMNDGRGAGIGKYHWSLLRKGAYVTSGVHCQQTPSWYILAGLVKKGGYKSSDRGQ
jgi:hypothetical protein